MHRIFALVLLFVAATFVPLSAQTEPPKRRPGPFLIYGPVHTIRDEQTTFQLVNGTLVEGPKVLVQTIEYNEDGTKQDRNLYVPGENMILRTVETFDSNGHILESTRFQRGVLTSREVTNYDDQKQLIERVTYRPDGSVSNRTVFARHGNERESETSTYDRAGNIIAQGKTKNDPPGKRADSILINPNGVVQSQSSIADNADGSREFKTERSNGDFQREVVTPLGKGSEERVKYNKDGSIKSKDRFIREYDSYQNMIKTTHLAAKSDSSEFEPVGTSYRTITYFGVN